jgi:hypothetical protein
MASEKKALSANVSSRYVSPIPDVDCTARRRIPDSAIACATFVVPAERTSSVSRLVRSAAPGRVVRNAQRHHHGVLSGDRLGDRIGLQHIAGLVGDPWVATLLRGENAVTTCPCRASSSTSSRACPPASS